MTDIDAHMIEAIARELDVPPVGTRGVAIGIEGLDGHVYSWAELTLAHVRLLKEREE